jgi:hypothetical protein
VTSRGNHRPAWWAAFTSVLTAAVTVALGAGTANADGPDEIVLTGIGLDEPMVFHAQEQPELFDAMYDEVAWLFNATDGTKKPDPDRLGPQFTVVVRADGDPRRRLHLYPLAEGGPRVFRPAEQPGDRTADEAWLLGRLSMPETLGNVGVPALAEYAEPDRFGGQGGGEESEEESRGFLTFLEEWREGMELTVLITVTILVLLGGTALLIRRYT